MSRRKHTYEVPYAKKCPICKGKKQVDGITCYQCQGTGKVMAMVSSSTSSGCGCALPMSLLVLGLLGAKATAVRVSNLAR